MEKQVNIIGLSYAQSQLGSYIAVVSEQDGTRKIPIIIKPMDAQVIALKIEGMKSPRPTTQDLMLDILNAYNVDVFKFIVYDILEGVFYSKMFCVDTDGNECQFECTTGDALALSMVFDAPLYVNESVLEYAGIDMTEDGLDIDKHIEDSKPKRPKKLTIDDLKQLMSEAERNEEYELAAEYRDKIKKLEEKLK